MSSKEEIKCEILSWTRIVKDVKVLSKFIKDSGYKIDIATVREVLSEERIL